jgi:alpha-tubulin suppressor-like RCC1 family protein
LGLGFSAPNECHTPAMLSQLENVVKVGCGYEHSIALTDEGEMYAWGHGEGGLLGHGDQDTQGVPMMIDEFKTRKKTITSFACGGLHTLAVTSDGLVFSWGRAEGGSLGHSKAKIENLASIELGIPSPVPIYSLQLRKKNVIAVDAGVAHSLALTDDGEVFGWGWNNYG